MAAPAAPSALPLNHTAAAVAKKKKKRRRRDAELEAEAQPAEEEEEEEGEVAGNPKRIKGNEKKKKKKEKLGRFIYICTCVCFVAYACARSIDLSIYLADEAGNDAGTGKGFLSLKKFEDLPLAAPTAKAVSAVLVCAHGTKERGGCRVFIFLCVCVFVYHSAGL